MLSLFFLAGEAHSHQRNEWRNKTKVKGFITCGCIEAYAAWNVILFFVVNIKIVFCSFLLSADGRLDY